MQTRRTRPVSLLILCALLLWALPRLAWAHIGSSDVFYESDAGPYRLFVTIRPPEVIPGVADVEIRAAAPDIEQLRIVPLPLAGEGARFAPVPDLAVRSPLDPQSFTGHLWMMTAGSWQVRILVDGKRGPGQLAVPVPTLPKRTAGMQSALAMLLLGLLGLLVAAMISVIGASAGEAQLEPGVKPAADVLRRGRRAMLAAGALLGLLLWGGALWWRAEAAKYDAIIYKPLEMKSELLGGRLRLTLSESGWLRQRLDDLLPDHGHLMHLFMLRQPELDQVFHLHPDEEGTGVFGLELPPVPAGRYRLYADIVHETGVPETLVSELEVPSAVAGQPLHGDDAAGSASPLSRADPTRTVSPLGGASQLVWLREAKYQARTPYWFRFRLEDQPGHPAEDVELYMGMLGHAAFVKGDGSVFAHVHPSGSVPMATLSLTAEKGRAGEHGMHHHSAAALPAEVSFPFGFPQAGDYRVFVQMKRAGSVVTGTFDIHVDPAN